MRFWRPNPFVVAGTVVAIALAWSCTDPDSPWFEGGMESARQAAEERDTLVMLDFYTDWCTWCKRLERETFADPAVRDELAAMVALKLNAEKSGAEAAAQYGVDSYPTIVFTDPDGEEVDRILGYRGPEDFVREVQRIRAGDTFMACLATLDEDPANLEALERAVSGFLDRSDTGAAIERIEAFHAADDGSRLDQCQQLMFTARQALHDETYQKAEQAYRRGFSEVPKVTATTGTEALAGLVNRLEEVESPAEALKRARHADAGAVLDLLPEGYPGPETALLAGRFAYQTGHYDRAEALYRGWFNNRGPGDQAAYLNEVAWNLYLMERDLDAALALAREAYESDPSPSVGDTLARLLYRAGDAEQAIEIQTHAAEAAEGPMADSYAAAARVMKNGGQLDDQPAFEGYPGRSLS